MSTQTQSISLFQKISSEDFSVILDLILSYRLNKRTFFFLKFVRMDAKLYCWLF